MALLINPPNRGMGSISTVQLPETWKKIRQEGLQILQNQKADIEYKRRADQKLSNELDAYTNTLRDSFKAAYLTDTRNNRLVANAVLKNMAIHKKNIETRGQNAARKWKALATISSEAGKISTKFAEVAKDKAEEYSKGVQARGEALEITLPQNHPYSGDLLGNALATQEIEEGKLKQNKDFLTLPKDQQNYVLDVHRTKGYKLHTLQNLNAINLSTNIPSLILKHADVPILSGPEAKQFGATLGEILNNQLEGDRAGAAKLAAKQKLVQLVKAQVGNDKAYFDHVAPALNHYLGGKKREEERTRQAKELENSGNDNIYNGMIVNHNLANKDNPLKDNLSWLSTSINKTREKNQSLVEATTPYINALAWAASKGDSQQAIDLATLVRGKYQILFGDEKPKPGTDVTMSQRNSAWDLKLSEAIASGQKKLAARVTVESNYLKARLETTKNKITTDLETLPPAEVNDYLTNALEQAKNQPVLAKWLASLQADSKGINDGIEKTKLQKRLKLKGELFPRIEILQIQGVSVQGRVELLNIYDEHLKTAPETQALRDGFDYIEDELSKLIANRTPLDKNASNFDSEFTHAKERYLHAYFNSKGATKAERHKEASDAFDEDVKNGYHAVHPIEAGSNKVGSFIQAWRPKTIFDHAEGFNTDSTYFSKAKVLPLSTLVSALVHVANEDGYISTKQMDRIFKRIPEDNRPTLTEFYQDQISAHGNEVVKKAMKNHPQWQKGLELTRQIEEYKPTSHWLEPLPGYWGADYSALKKELENPPGYWANESTFNPALRNYFRTNPLERIAS